MSAAEPAGGSVPEPQSRAAGTEYVIFVQQSAATDDVTVREAAAKLWKHVDAVTAKTPEAAVRQYAQASGAKDTLTLAAVASRHWFTDTLKPNTVTTWESA